MIYRLNQVIVPLEYTEKSILNKITRITRLHPSDLKSWKIIRRSLDARKEPMYSLIIEIETDKPLRPSRDIQEYNQKEFEGISLAIQNFSGKQPVVVGAGPAGLMAALTLAENGVKPIVLERGSDAKNRARAIAKYLQTGELNTETNILFGEGGAGLFSDGKLTARSKERRIIHYFFEKLVECGADKDILIEAEPHLGSDMLLKIIPLMREKIISLGGEFHFDTKVTDIEIIDGKLSAVITENNRFETEHCIMAVGHSARDIYKMLSRHKVAISPKPFAIGVRVELPQQIVDVAQYGKHAGNPRLGAASFKLTRKDEGDFRSCYSFCMCPGGTVMPCASSEGEITTNGMSLSTRSGSKANAAFLVPVTEKDYTYFYDENYPELSGVFFQEYYEKKIYTAGGNNYSIPASRLSDFLKNRISKSLPNDYSCQRTTIAKVNDILPGYVEKTLKNSIPKMIRKLGCNNFEDVTIFCGETRSSSPVRIDRDKDTLESITTRGLFPSGEGAGFAGGIVSSAIDGIKSAESVLKIIAKN